MGLTHGDLRSRRITGEIFKLGLKSFDIMRSGRALLDFTINLLINKIKTQISSDRCPPLDNMMIYFCIHVIEYDGFFKIVSFEKKNLALYTYTFLMTIDVYRPLEFTYLLNIVKDNYEICAHTVCMCPI